MLQERAKTYENTRLSERAKANENPKKKERERMSEMDTNVLAVRMLVRAREDYQSMRKRMDNRTGKKADGTDQNRDNLTARAFSEEDVILFRDVADTARREEERLEKALTQALKRFPIYTGYLVKVKGVGPIAAGHIVGEYDIVKATTVSKLWQFTGLNPGLVRGMVRVQEGKDKWYYQVTDKLIRGDKLTPGFVAPFNQRLRTAMVGVLADGFIKAQAPYALNFYYPYKARLEQEENLIAGEEKAWNEVCKARRDRAAKRYMIKQFLKDLYVAWRTMEGLPVRPPYAEEYLGVRHNEEPESVYAE